MHQFLHEGGLVGEEGFRATDQNVSRKMVAVPELQMSGVHAGKDVRVAPFPKRPVDTSRDLLSVVASDARVVVAARRGLAQGPRVRRLETVLRRNPHATLRVGLAEFGISLRIARPPG